jgi:hypothetical protein
LFLHFVSRFNGNSIEARKYVTLEQLVIKSSAKRAKRYKTNEAYKEMDNVLNNTRTWRKVKHFCFRVPLSKRAQNLVHCHEEKFRFAFFFDSIAFHA